jgi:hypothetical protein
MKKVIYINQLAPLSLNLRPGRLKTGVLTRAAFYPIFKAFKTKNST